MSLKLKSGAMNKTQKTLLQILIICALVGFTQASVAKYLPSQAPFESDLSDCPANSRAHKDNDRTILSQEPADIDPGEKKPGKKEPGKEELGKAPPSKESKRDACVSCHSNTVNPGAVAQWHDSKHAKVGVSCIDCHGASKDDVDSWLHKGSYISSIVTPK
ncbi:MAG: hypothetical protein K8F91_19955, partial [Candidatus Obscuribacterales bacterium]|nr:hypothetical protein [Candidatus Obscuribacterales bacterium]